MVTKLLSLITHRKSFLLIAILSCLFIGFFPTLTQAAAPIITAITPSLAPTGSPDITVVISGSGFDAGSKIIFGPPGSTVELDPNPGTINPTTLSFDIPASKLTIENSFVVMVKNSAGELSNNDFHFDVQDIVGDSMKSTIKGLSVLYPWLKIADPTATSPIINACKTIIDMIRSALQEVATYAGWTLKLVLESITKNENWSITKATNSAGAPTFAGSAFLIAWGKVKDWANLLIVLGLIAIALATILRWPNDWQAKKLLPALLLVALFINFSVVFIGLIIDASNLLMQGLLGTTNSTEGSDLVLKINQAWDASGRKMVVIDNAGLLSYAGLSLMFALLYILVMIPLFWFALIFIERYVMIAILFIISPLAFIAFIFTPFRSHFTKWRDSFVKWSFIGLGAAFFLNLATGILRAFFNTSSSTGALIIGTPGEIVELIFKLLIVTGFMITGLKLLAKADGIAKLVMAAAAAVVAAIVTGGASVMGSAGAGALKIAGNSKYGEAIKEGYQDLRNRAKDRYSKFRENIGLDKAGIAEGRTQARNKAALKEPTERLENIPATDNARLARIAERGGVDGAAATNVLKKRNALHEINTLYRERVVTNAKKYDNELSTSDFAKSHFEYAHLDDSAMTRAMALPSVIAAAGGPGASTSALRTAAERHVNSEQLAKNLQGMSDRSRQRINHSYLTPQFIANNFTPNIVSSYESADTPTRLRIRASRPYINRLIDSVRPQLPGGAPNPNSDPSEFNRLRKLYQAIDDIQP